MLIRALVVDDENPAREELCFLLAGLSDVEVAGQAAVLGRPREILLSGRLGRVPWVAGEVTRRLGDVAPVRRVEGFAEKVKEAAQGAALIAQGLLGGEFASLVEAMGIRAARGTVLDNLYVDGADEVRRSYRSAESDPQPLWERR